MAKEILIVDSEKGNREEFKVIFEAADYNVVFLDSGEQALLRIKLFKPDLIILGASLKEKSGLEVFKAIKADIESKQIPVIFLSNLLKEISEEERERIQADGVITKPFHEDEILNLVDRLVEEVETGSKKEGIVGREMEWGSIADIGKARSEKEEEFLAEKGEEEEIIDLVDVVGEPDLKMSIHDFLTTAKEEPLAGITPLESWEKLMEEEKPSDRSFKFAPDEKEMEAKGLPLQLDEELVLRGGPSDKDLFDKIELEEILQKVEELAPAIEKEWPSEVKREVKPEVKQEAEQRVKEPVLPTGEEAAERFAGLAEFEAALKRGVGDELLEREAPSLFAEGRKKEAPEKIVPIEVSLKEELEEARGEEFPESLFEKIEEEEIGVTGEPKGEGIEIFEEVGIPEAEKEEIEVLEEPEKEMVEIFKEIEVPEVEKEEIEVLEEPEKEMVEIFKEIEVPEVEKEEIEVFEKAEKERVERFEEVAAPEVVAPIVQREKIIPSSKVVERQMEEVISKGAREMMEGFITKLVPEMTQSIINLTLERIEKMVKEIVPDLAEKIIQEEIKRLQKGEKD
jgi:CheY-like chemotaxis protein